MSCHNASISDERRQAAIRVLREIKGPAIIKHEQEELLFKLSQVDDAKLRELALHEMDRIRPLSPGRCFFDPA